MPTPSRRIRYQVAASLDGYVAGPSGEADWIPSHPDIDFGALFAQFDTFLMGRRTFEATVARHGGNVSGFGAATVVVSRTLRPADYPGLTVVGDGLREAIAQLKAKPGKDIWLFGGGGLCRSLLDLGLLDTMEIAVCPVILGGGIPLVATPAPTTRLRLTGERRYEKSGIVLLEYTLAAGE